MGNYVNRNLMPGETVVYEAHYHWAHYLSFQAIISLGIIPLLHNHFHEFVVTNRRIILKKGIIMVDTFEMNLSRVESVQVNQTIIGSVLGYGDITIIGTGGTKETFHGISNPDAFRRHFIEIA